MESWEKKDPEVTKAERDEALLLAKIANCDFGVAEIITMTAAELAVIIRLARKSVLEK